MSIKKQGVLLVSMFLVIITFLFRPTNVFAVKSCDDSGCSNEKCTACCRKFESDTSLGKERFRVKGYEKSFQKSCKKYMKFMKGKRDKSNDANYCLSVCTNSEGENFKSSCFKKCCKEFNCSGDDLTQGNTTAGTNTTTSTNSTQNTANSKNVNSPGNNDITTCEGLLGDAETQPDSVAWLVQKILDYLKIIGPLLVVILSSTDFAKAIIMNDDENMKKAQKKLITRLLAAVLLFFIPTVVQMLLDIFGITSCNIY